VDTILGLIGVVVWIVCVIALAASVTWAVVKLLPGEKTKTPADDAAASEST
jgi:hypothetical protein